MYLRFSINTSKYDHLDPISSGNINPDTTEYKYGRYGDFHLKIGDFGAS